MDEILPPRRLSELIGAIYDCALDPGGWETALADIADTFECSVVSLTLNDVHRNRFLLNKAVGWEPALLRLKSERHVAEINARLTEWLALQSSIDELFVTSVHLSQDYIRQSLYVEECLKPQGIVDIMHMFLRYTHSQFSEIGLGRHARQGVITEREVELGRLLLPHLRKAVTISGILDAQAIELGQMAQALDALVCGVVLTDERGSIVHANRSAERMMREGNPIRSARNVLAAGTPAASRELRSAISLAARDTTQLGQRSAVRLPDSGASPPLYAHVLPLTAGRIRTRLHPQALAAVFIGGTSEQGRAELLAGAFDLTSAEGRVLESLVAGHSLAETARHLGIAPSTAKTHLDHIFAKTGVSRQTELIRLAMRMALPVDADAPAAMPPPRAERPD